MFHFKEMDLGLERHGGRSSTRLPREICGYRPLGKFPFLIKHRHKLSSRSRWRQFHRFERRTHGVVRHRFDRRSSQPSSHLLPLSCQSFYLPFNISPSLLPPRLTLPSKMHSVITSPVRPICINKPLPPHPTDSPKPSTPIPIPRRKSVHPPPCSPIRDQASPDLVFNFDFSVSPERHDSMTQMLLEQRGAGVRLFPLNQKTRYAPFTAGTGVEVELSVHPYAREPFLYSIPKILARDTQPGQHVRARTSTINGEGAGGGAADQERTAPVHARIPSTSSSMSFSSYPSSTSSLPVSTSVSVDLDVNSSCGSDDGINVLTTAFQRSLISASNTSVSPSAATSFAEGHHQAPSQTTFRPLSPISPPLSSRFGTHPLRQPRPKPLQPSKAGAAPVVSLDVAQAEQLQCWCTPSTRTLRDRGWAWGGRVVSMMEYGSGRMSLVLSDEELERSLEKDALDSEGEEPQTISERERGENADRDREKIGEQERERGRTRGRAPARGPDVSRLRAMPGWQWADARGK
ncbi:hypothetical protein A0H81_08601 [Grifola frondosa]|uniref:Uncharacterized protein n=1 Tax=Grifola frondosa TaxID=5627 RepID=A0A1C7M4I2_GRIFR|nr:hypothetical protein A0H81_08601 [Grifola frondosa]